MGVKAIGNDLRMGVCAAERRREIRVRSEHVPRVHIGERREQLEVQVKLTGRVVRQPIHHAAKVHSVVIQSHAAVNRELAIRERRPCKANAGQEVEVLG